MQLLQTYWQSLLHLFFPHACNGCYSTNVQPNSYLCINCIEKLPPTHFENIKDNVVEKIFVGRLPLHFAMAAYYFTPQSLLQKLLHELKYKNNQAIGFYLGQLLGYKILQSNYLHNVNCIVPLPLHPKKEHKRGYNQAMLIAEGISKVISKPIINHAVKRSVATATQTKANRLNRWNNMSEAFTLHHTHTIKDKHVLLVDDVITTGATLEACGKALITAGCSQLSIATIAYTQ